MTLTKGFLTLAVASGAAATPYVAYRLLWEGNLNKPSYETEVMEDGRKLIKNNYKVWFSNFSSCFSNLFGKDFSKKKMLEKPTLNLSTDPIDLGSELSKIKDAKSGCFYMETKKSKNGESVFGFSELVIGLDNSAIVMQTEFNLGASSPSISDYYFRNKVSFLKKESETWKLNKSLAWNENVEYSKSDDVVDSTTRSHLTWVKNDTKQEPLLKLFNFKQDTKLWKNTHSGKLDLKTKDIKFLYSSDRWLQNRPMKVTVKEDSEWWKDIPKGEWKTV